MIEKIKVVASPSETAEKTFEIDPVDMGYTMDRWENLSESVKEGLIQQYLDQLPEQPYWTFNRVKEE